MSKAFDEWWEALDEDATRERHDYEKCALGWNAAIEAAAKMLEARATLFDVEQAPLVKGIGILINGCANNIRALAAEEK